MLLLFLLLFVSLGLFLFVCLFVCCCFWLFFCVFFFVGGGRRLFFFLSFFYHDVEVVPTVCTASLCLPVTHVVLLLLFVCLFWVGVSFSCFLLS